LTQTVDCQKRQCLIAPTFCNGRYHKNVDKRGAVTLTHQGHLLGVTAEGCYVLLDPVQSGDEVEQGVVSRSIAVFSAQKTFRQQSTNQIRSSICKVQYTPPTPTRLNCRVASHRRRRCEQNSQLAHDDCRRIWSTIWKLTKQTPQRFDWVNFDRY